MLETLACLTINKTAFSSPKVSISSVACQQVVEGAEQETDCFYFSFQNQVDSSCMRDHPPMQLAETAQNIVAVIAVMKYNGNEGYEMLE